MASGTNSQDEEITGINVTPLVDVMLVLLIIFMVTATYIANQSIQVSLPKAATGESPQSVNLAFVLDKDAKLYLDGKELSFEAVGAAIEEKRKETSAAIQALIAADQATPHGAVVRIIDVVRKHGIVDFALNVEVAP
jgi:biopolymer transport protein ExbD